jgi:hypothetical protein
MPDDKGSAPNLYNLRGKDVHVVYSTSGIDGRPHFEYQDAAQTLQFTGDDIRTVKTDIGTLVTVSIRRTVDTGYTSFSVLLPEVNLADGTQCPIGAEGIRIVHRFSAIPRFNVGQRDNYTSIRLTGTASFVLF